MGKKEIVNVQGMEIAIQQNANGDYICITDIANSKPLNQMP
jgi:hypothetical protein